MLKSIAFAILGNSSAQTLSKMLRGKSAIALNNHRTTNNPGSLTLKRPC